MKDLHLHLSGATNQVTLFELIKENGFRTKNSDYWEFIKTVTMDRSKVQSLDEYLAILHVIDDAQSYPRAIERCFYEAYRDSYLVGCEELQLRWNPVKRSQEQKIDLDSLIIAARAGAERAKNFFGIEGSMLLCMGRDISPAANEAIFNKAIKYLKKGVIGIDVAGSESIPLTDEFDHYYKTLNALGGITTIHCGETLNDNTERELQHVIEVLQPKRIGHGIQIIHFPKLMEIAVKKGIVFEVCLTSNLTTKALADHDQARNLLKTFQKNNVEYVVCTDATYAIGTDLRKENDLHNLLLNRV